MAEGKTPEDEAPEGLGGWLILVGIGSLIAPMRVVVLLLYSYSAIVGSGAWSAIAADNPWWAAVLVVEAAVNVALIAAWAVAAYLFFSKKRLFRPWYIGLLAFSLGFLVADTLVMKLVLPQVPLFDADTLRSFAQGAVAAAIWIPYMLASKRAAATFVR